MLYGIPEEIPQSKMALYVAYANYKKEDKSQENAENPE